MLSSRKSIVGLDIGSSCIKAIEITKDRFDYVITGYGQVEVGSDVARAEAIAELFREVKLRTKKVITSVSGKSVIVRYITMVRMSDENLKKAIKFEADKYIPFDIEEVQIDCQRLDYGAPKDSEEEEGQAEMKVLLVAVKRSLVEEQARMLTELGLQPLAIDVDAFALGTAFEQCEGLSPTIEDSERVVALVDIGANKTCINILKGSTSCFTREVYIGGNDLTNAINRRLGVEPFEAEFLKRDPQDRASEVEEAVQPLLEDLANEVNLSFDYFENQMDSEVTDVYLSGGTAMMQGLDEILERIFERRTRVWNPIEGLKVKSDNVDIDSLNRCAPQLAVAVGLAARIG